MKPEPKYSHKQIWSSADGYERHRIPGMIVTDRGTLIIYNEARRTGSDWAVMDIFMQRSEDCGDTFGEPVYLARGTEKHKTVNNPVMMQDRNGRLHFIYCEDYSVNGGRVLRRFSDDDGLSWSDCRDITCATLPDFRNVFATGPGHGILTPAGALVVPVWMVPKQYASPLYAHDPSVISTLYSLDDGETWNTGEIMTSCETAVNPNETTVALLSDGRVYLNARCSMYSRAVAVSPDGYSGWSTLTADTNLKDPKCFGSAANFCGEGRPFTVLFANCESQKERKNVTVKGSTDNAETWSLRKVIDADSGGYVEIAADGKRNLIYVLYETLYGETCNLAVFNYEWLLGASE